jgi:hypothetical protein
VTLDAGKVPPLGHSPVVIERSAVAAVDPALDAILGAKAALRGAVSVRESARARMFGAAEREVERLRLLVKRLEGR